MKRFNSHLVLFLATVCFFVGKIVAQNDVMYVPCTAKKINQLVGDWDNERGQPAQNKTQTRYNLPNTDLGAPLEHNGKAYEAFGEPGIFF